ncbi:hypothetical protein CGRA01v4_11175 [Colletotrichum graminicola]|nr:hypothetical protein CGRA01v4_11175 [Colletotrichum graminicola]
MFTWERTVLAAIIVTLGLVTFVAKLASAVKDDPDSLGFVHAHAEARLLDVDVGFVHKTMSTALRLVVVMVLARRCFGGYTNIPLLLFGRAVHGLGAAGLITLVNICICDLFSLRGRGLYFGLRSIVWALASGLGPVLGGVFTD